MAEHVCPPWIGFLMASRLRRLVHDPNRILRPYVAEGMTVLEPGPGMGFFTLELARLVGPRGKVVAVDLEPRMLLELARRARAAGVGAQVQTLQAQPLRLGVEELAGAVDFALAFYMVHELPSAPAFFDELRRALRPGGRLLFVEPRRHVSAAEFAGSLRDAEEAGLRVHAAPPIRWSRAAVLVRA